MEYNGFLKESIYLKNAFALAILACGLIGCQNNASPIVGTWDMSGIGGATGMTSTFGGDGKVATHLVLPGTSPATTLDMTGTYKLEKETLTIDYTDVKISNLPDAVKSQEPVIKKQILDGQDATRKSTVKWESNDSFTMTNAEGKTATFTRKK